jgi:uncharacterized protein (DUF1684 family)
MRSILAIILCLFTIACFAQNTSHTALSEIEAFQTHLNKEFKDPEKSPLEKKARRKFKKHHFFEIDLKYRVEAELTITSTTEFFTMKTTTNRLPEYRVYGMLEFSLNGEQFHVPVYQSKDLLKKLEYKDYLFFPFTDLTNGATTYGGGRYIELRIPAQGEKAIVDFNQAYNPYCAYSGRYSCPIVPAENHLGIEVLAGVKYTDKKSH